MRWLGAAQVRPGMFVQQQQEVRSKQLCKEADKALEVAIERGMAAGSTVTFAMASEQKPGPSRAHAQADHLQTLVCEITGVAT